MKVWLNVKDDTVFTILYHGLTPRPSKEIIWIRGKGSSSGSLMWVGIKTKNLRKYPETQKEADKHPVIVFKKDAAFIDNRRYNHQYKSFKVSDQMVYMRKCRVYLDLCSGDKIITEENSLKKQPNFIIILSDQERFPTQWPKNWAEENLTAWDRLKRIGLTFNKAYTSSCHCSPSRACLLTGEYSNVNKIPSFEFDNIPKNMPGIDELPNIASVLKTRGYDVVWKGKWHLSFPLSCTSPCFPGKEVWTEEDIKFMEENYGMAEWNAPDAGNSAFVTNDGLKTLGGGNPNNDGRYVNGEDKNNPYQTPGLGESVIEYLNKIGKIPSCKRNPFCLFVSLVNPHDVPFYPIGWDVAGYKLEDFQNLGINLPENVDDDLSTKPTVQRLFRDALNIEGPLITDQDKLNYVNFYAYLHKIVNGHIESVLDSIEENGLLEDTVIIRTADHGELGLSHMLREKDYSAYEECIHIPLVISNPILFPKGECTNAFYSHVDLLATIADFADAKPTGIGNSLFPVVMNWRKDVQKSVLFTYDDTFLLPSNTPSSHMRVLRKSIWTYSAYYSPDGDNFQFELYDNDKDPNQLNNLLYEPDSKILPIWKYLNDKLYKKMKKTSALPPGFTWPDKPWEHSSPI